MIKFAALIIKVNNVKLKVMSKIDSFYLPQLPRNENIGFHSKPTPNDDEVKVSNISFKKYCHAKFQRTL